MTSAEVSSPVVLSTSASTTLQRALLQINPATLSPVVSVCGSQVASGQLEVAGGAALDIDMACSYGTEVWNVQGQSNSYKVSACFLSG